MKPTPGRIVHYQPSASQLGYAAPDASGVIPALVTGVQPSGAVNLYLFPNCGAGAMWIGTITEGDGPGRWRWPPRAPQQAAPSPGFEEPEDED